MRTRLGGPTRRDFLPDDEFSLPSFTPFNLKVCTYTNVCNDANFVYLHMVGIFAMSSETTDKMARTRALMTKTDRQQIAGGEGVDENNRYQAISRVRSRINEELPKDIEVLQEHHPELYKELRDIVCDCRE